MEIVIENPSDNNTNGGTSMVMMPNIKSGFGTLPANNHSYRTAYSIDGGISTVPEYYGTLPPRGRPSSYISIPHQPEFNPTTAVRRVDKSGLLEIAEPEPISSSSSSSSHTRHLTGAENPSHTSRIDRLGLLEVVPEVPDQLQGQKSPELSKVSRSKEDFRNRSISERQLTGAEIDCKDQQISKPNAISLTPEPSSKAAAAAAATVAASTSLDPSNQVDESHVSTPSSIHGGTGVTTATNTQSASPYFRRIQLSPKPSTDNLSTSSIVVNNTIENDGRNNSSFSNQITSNIKYRTNSSNSGSNGSVSGVGLDSRGRQSYIDLTGATYTRASVNSPILVSSRVNSTSEMSSKVDSGDNIKQLQPQLSQHQQPPDCLMRSSPRLGSERHSPQTTVSSIPDVIEAHGSKVNNVNSSGSSRSSCEIEIPKGERAEAEGCEHTAIESLEETRVSFKASNKLLHNDNIQTLRVIILSEQL